MDTNPSPRSRGWLSNRTRLVTVASVVAVGAAGAVAFGANLGLLDSAGAGPVGTATAAELAPTTSRVVDVYLPTTTAAPTTAAPTTAAGAATAAAVASAPAAEEFEVDVAGTVSVVRDGATLRLDRVAPAPGWTWSLRQPRSSALVVTLTNGARTFEFHASIAADGSIAASVNEPVAARPAPAAAPSGAGEGEHHEQEHEEHEYEGGDEDD